MFLPRRTRSRIACLLACCCFLVLLNLYLLHLPKDDGRPSLRFGIDSRSLKLGEKITKVQRNSSIRRLQLVSSLKEELKCFSQSATVEWNVTAGWITRKRVLSDHTPLLGCLIRRLTSAPIVKATSGTGGTQLKLLLTLEGGQIVVFKPQRYRRNEVIEGNPYAGFDRHNGEIAAFHLSRLLNMKRGPIVAGRSVSVSKEIMPVADRKLLSTFVTKDSRVCFYGVCYYCNENDAVCADKNEMLEGAVIMWLPTTVKLTKTIRHPWSRTYKDGVKAKWEINDRYCEDVKRTPRYKSSSSLLLDIMDTSVFDFLIGNADRHNYQLLEGLDNSMLVLLDNGKSFGNSSHDELSILAPLHQCCTLRKSTWERILLFVNNGLGESLEELLSEESLSPILTAGHFKALDRRLAKVREAVIHCIAKRGNSVVLVN